MQDINEEWLSDKSRFAYDGLKRQRLISPMTKDANGQLVGCGWEEAFFKIVDKVSKPCDYDESEFYILYIAFMSLSV